MMPILLALFACKSYHTYEGIAVGNPGTTALRVAPAEGLDFSTARAEGVTVSVQDCDGGSVVLAEDISFDLSRGASLVMPEGTWCGLTLDAPDWIYILAEESEEGRAELFLVPPSIEMVNSAGFVVDGQDFLLELASPGWVTVAELGIEYDTVVQVKGDHPAVPALTEAVQTESTLFVDGDLDGVVTDADEAVADALDGVGETDAAGGEGGGCQAAPLPLAPVLALLPLVAALRRRR